MTSVNPEVKSVLSRREVSQAGLTAIVSVLWWETLIRKGTCKSMRAHMGAHEPKTSL